MHPHLQLPFGAIPIYGLCMLVGVVLGLVLAMRWARQRGIDPELIVELAIVGLVCGILGARIVFIVEQWDTMFADRPPGRLSHGLAPRHPLTKDDVLVLRTAQGQAAVRFTGDEHDTAAVVKRIAEQGQAAGIEVVLRERAHRGDQGVVNVVRGFAVRTTARGKDAWLEVEPGPAASKLGLQPGVTKGEDVPFSRVFNLREGGLTYFGSVFGVLGGWLWWLRRRRADIPAVFDAVAPILPLGLFFGRLGCLSRGCCWGREVGEHALVPGLTFPRGSLPWLQMAEERLPCTFDPLLSRVTATEPLAPALDQLLRPAGLADGTPPLHPAQLYEGVGVLLIAAFLVVYRDRWQRRVGQTFILTLLLQAPLRFAVEHLRRDHDVFVTALGYPLTETQVVAIIVLCVAIPLLRWVHLHGRPQPPLVPFVKAPGPEGAPA